MTDREISEKIFEHLAGPDPDVIQPGDPITLTASECERIVSGDIKFARLRTKLAGGDSELLALLSRDKLVTAFVELRDFSIRDAGMDRYTQAKRMVTEEWLKKAAPAVYSGYCTQCMVDAVNNFTLIKMNEDGWFRCILPPVGIN